MSVLTQRRKGRTGRTTANDYDIHQAPPVNAVYLIRSGIVWELSNATGDRMHVLLCGGCSK